MKNWKLYPLTITVILAACTSKDTRPEGATGEGRRSMASVGTHPVPMADHPKLYQVCQYEQFVNQTPTACAKVVHSETPVERKLYQEYPSFQPSQILKMAGEVGKAYAARAEKVTDELRKDGQLRENDTNYDGRRHRLTHSKTHMCAVGNLTIAKNVPKELQVGIFAKPGSYKTFSRFANGTTFVKPDVNADPDTRSHSIKIIGAPGEKMLYGSENTMDIVMNAAPVFIFKSPQRFTEFFTKVMSRNNTWWGNARKKVDKVKEFITGDEGAAAAVLTGNPPLNLLEANYYSGIALRWGNVAGKVRLQYVSCPEAKGARADLSQLDQKNPDLYRAKLKQQLEVDKIPACWNVQFQVQRDPWKQPIEDTTIEWKEKDAPFVTIGHLRIQPQTIDDQRKLNVCDGLSYNAWRVPEEMRPLGDLARLRGMAYYYSAKARREHNRVDETEPRGDELD